jgi:hypothetical protein
LWCVSKGLLRVVVPIGGLVIFALHQKEAVAFFVNMSKKTAAALKKCASAGSAEGKVLINIVLRIYSIVSGSDICEFSLLFVSKIGTRRSNQVQEDALEEGSIDIGACSLCHCALDFSDRAAFFQSDREEDYKDEKDEDASSESSYFFNKNDPYLPESLWDPNNALVYCDSCERMFHQKCHFVPIFSVPRGAWHCLYCLSQKQNPSKKNLKKSLDVAGNQKRTADPLPEFFKELDAADIALPSGKDDNSKPAAIRDLLFVSPPIPEVAEWERRWEAASRLLKAATWHGAFSQLRNAISGQLATHRLARAGLQTWTSTSHNFHFFQNSQELHDTLIKMFGAEYRIRGWLSAVETCRSTWPGEKMWRTLLEWTQKHEKSHTDFVKRVLFPFGRLHPRRIEPKTPEYRLHGEEAQSSILNELDKSETTLLSKGGAHAKDNAQLAKETRKGSTKESDDDSGITLDELVCCICMEGYATDENDLVLCDGNGCFRAYHQHCVKPVVRLTEDEEDDWFCPLCAGQAELLHHVQCEYMGDEWEQRRIHRQLSAEDRNAGKSKKKTTDVIDDSSSLRSWADVNEVFPNAEVDYPAAIMLRKGRKNAASIALVNRVLGLEEDMNDELSAGDDDESDDDEKFDLNSFERRKKEERQNARLVDNDSSNEDITVSSAATLEEISSVELEIDRDELAALSDGEGDDTDENQSFEKVFAKRNTKGMRLRSKRLYDIGRNSEDIGKLDESNIIDGKRGRAPVDYILLNRSIFGDLSQDEAAEIDDDDDFVMKQTDVTGRCSDSTSASSEERSPYSESDPLTPATTSLDGSSLLGNKTANRSRKRGRESSCTSRFSNAEMRNNHRFGE